MAGRWVRRFAVSTAVAGCLASLTGAASAQAVPTNVDLPKFNPSEAGDRFFGVPSPYAAGEATLHAMALLDYAREPLKLVRDNDESVGNVVSDQMFVHLGVNFALMNRFALSLNMPFAVVSSGDALNVGGVNTIEPAGATLGDLRLGLRARLIGEYFDGFQLAVGGYMWLPTGGSDSYVSNGSVRGQPMLLLGGREDRFIWSLMAGPSFRAATDIGNVQTGYQMNWGAGAGVLLGDERAFQLGLETTGGVDVENPGPRNTNAEALVGAKLRVISPLEIGLGVGPGFTSGIGTPAFRGVFQIAYTPEMEREKSDRDGDGIYDDVDACPDVPGIASEDPAKHGCPESDRDKDGILDDVDACPDEPGVKSDDPAKNGCPVRDSDKDGILDDVDACPNEPGVPSDDPAKHGCPLNDKDGDGILDEVDACPEIPGVKSDDPKQNGCPPDTDGDGFRDDQDACPREKGVDDPDPTKRGCPKLVRVTEQEIIILEQVQFDTGKATIKKVSDPLLDSVAQVLKEHPEILKIEVQGHTDDRGSKQLNDKLSKDRAASVKKALEQRGVEGSRLTSQGYGMDKPIADNKTEDGRAKNRRVQFVVTDKKPAPAK